MCTYWCRSDTDPPPRGLVSLVIMRRSLVASLVDNNNVLFDASTVHHELSIDDTALWVGSGLFFHPCSSYSESRGCLVLERLEQCFIAIICEGAWEKGPIGDFWYHENSKATPY